MAADPISATASAVAAATATVGLTIIGVDPTDLIWVAVGTAVGITASPPMSRTRAALVFVATCLAGALLARLGARLLDSDDELTRRTIALAVGASFPVIKDRLIAQAIPAVIDRILASKGAAK